MKLPPGMREAFATVLDWLLLALLVLVVATFMIGFTALIFAQDARAETFTPPERNTTLLRPAVKVKLVKQESGIVACMIAIDDVIAGEWIELRGSLGATNGTWAPIGVTTEVMVWENNAWANLRSDTPNQADGSELAGGNLTPDQHHWTYTSNADYLTRDYAGRVWFGVGVWAYRKPDPAGYLDLDGCQIRAVRHRV